MTGRKLNAAFVSLLTRCGLHNIEPLGYLRDLFCLQPHWPRHRVLELGPVNWSKTLEQREAQQTLDANLLRRFVLGLSGCPPVLLTRC